MHIFSQFQRGYTKGEASAVLLQEGGLFLGLLRHDLINAVQDPSLPPVQWQKAVSATANSLTLQRFKDRDGNRETIEYRLKPTPNQGGTLVRYRNGKEDRTLIRGHVTSMKWDVTSAQYPTTASPVRLIWIDLDMELNRGRKGATAAVPFRVQTKLFPTRLNQLLNR